MRRKKRRKKRKRKTKIRPFISVNHFLPFFIPVRYLKSFSESFWSISHRFPRVIKFRAWEGHIKIVFSGIFVIVIMSNNFITNKFANIFLLNNFRCHCTLLVPLIKFFSFTPASHSLLLIFIFNFFKC